MPIVWAECTTDDRDLITSVLESEPGRPGVRFVCEGGEVLQEIHRKRPRLVVLDLDLPKRNGLDVLRRLRQDEKAQDLPVVVFSTTKSPEEVQACQRLGVVDFIQKPYDFKDFARAVKAIVARAA